MSEAKHTPGPWMVGGSITGPRAAATVWLDYSPESGDGHKYGATWITKNGRLVAIVPHGEGDAAADAALIVTAVNSHADLLAACQLAVSWLDNKGYGGKLYRSLTAAIAKATT